MHTLCLGTRVSFSRKSVHDGTATTRPECQRTSQQYRPSNKLSAFFLVAVLVAVMDVSVRFTYPSY